MKLTQAQQTSVLIVLVVILVLLIGYRILTEEKPKTAPLTYQRGAVASSPVRRGLSSTRRAGADPLNAFLERRSEKYPGVGRDIFRMENPVPKPKVVVSHITATPPVHVKTPEEIAADAAQAAAQALQAVADAARTDLNKFKYLGYLTEKDNTLFLSKEGELFIVKRGDTILKSYKVKEVNKNYVVLLDTVTGVEVQLELSGAESATQSPPMTHQPQQQAPQQQPLTQMSPQQRRPLPAPTPGR
jgi:hypothetical protein